jgi:hypothetical protein
MAGIKITEPSPVFDPEYTKDNSSIFRAPKNDVPPSPFVENALGFDDMLKVELSMEFPPAYPPPPPPELQPPPPYFLLKKRK